MRYSHYSKDAFYVFLLKNEPVLLCLFSGFFRVPFIADAQNDTSQRRDHKHGCDQNCDPFHIFHCGSPFTVIACATGFYGSILSHSNRAATLARTLIACKPSCEIHITPHLWQEAAGRKHE